MSDGKKITFEEIFEQNERRIHYQIQLLHINDTHREFYVEGMYAMWRAYKKYQPDKGPLATYFNYTIRNHLIDTLRKKTRDERNNELFIQEETKRLDNGNRFAKTNIPIMEPSDITVNDAAIWDEVKALLTENQWKWVESFIIQDLSIKEIVVKEGVSANAVKSWGRETRKKLRENGFGEYLE